MKILKVRKIDAVPSFDRKAESFLAKADSKILDVIKALYDAANVERAVQKDSPAYKFIQKAYDKAVAVQEYIAKRR